MLWVAYFCCSNPCLLWFIACPFQRRWWKLNLLLTMILLWFTCFSCLTLCLTFPSLPSHSTFSYFEIIVPRYKSLPLPPPLSPPTNVLHRLIHRPLTELCGDTTDHRRGCRRSQDGDAREAHCSTNDHCVPLHTQEINRSWGNLCSDTPHAGNLLNSHKSEVPLWPTG